MPDSASHSGSQRSSTAAVAPDFSRAVLEDLYRYPRKRQDLAGLLWLLTGLFGGHRFYLGRTATALIMAATAGGFLVWWLVDIFLIGRMVEACNSEQQRRRSEGLPPMALSFMPPVTARQLPAEPEWIARRRGQGRLLGDFVLLTFAGISVGVLTSSTGNYEPIVVIVALAGIILLGARWDALATIPILRNFDRWSHRLRLYYYVNDPGGPLRLLLRPLAGLVTAPFRQRARAEAWLYLQLGLWFTVLFTAVDVLQAISIDENGIDLDLSELIEDFVMTLVTVYCFAAPIGAVLTTQVLLEKRDRVVWLLCAVTLVAIVWGFMLDV